MARVTIGLGEGLVGVLLVLLGVYYAPINGESTTLTSAAAGAWILGAVGGAALGILGVRKGQLGALALAGSALCLLAVVVLISVVEPARVFAP